jgi:putative membrane protein|tara:strand:- start:373 stop:528 length:156 start_codon:yes stop_codon:yes gene_type:complete
LILSLLVFFLGFSVERIGIAKGVLFGSYSYGSAFDLNFLKNPLRLEKIGCF